MPAPVSTSPTRFRRLRGQQGLNLFTALPTTSTTRWLIWARSHDVTVMAARKSHPLRRGHARRLGQYTTAAYAYLARQCQACGSPTATAPTSQRRVSRRARAPGAAHRRRRAQGPSTPWGRCSNIGLNVTAWSYLDQVHVSAIACRTSARLLPPSWRAWITLDELRRALDLMRPEPSAAGAGTVRAVSDLPPPPPPPDGPPRVRFPRQAPPPTACR